MQRILGWHRLAILTFLGSGFAAGCSQPTTQPEDSTEPASAKQSVVAVAPVTTDDAAPPNPSAQEPPAAPDPKPTKTAQPEEPAPPREPPTPPAKPAPPKVDRAEDKEEVDEEFEIDAASLAQVKTGMSPSEVSELLGGTGERISSGEGDNAVYRWAGSDGASFLARFEQGALARSTTLRRVPEETEGEPTAGPALTESDYDQVRPGMRLDEVLALLDVEAEAVVDSPDAVAVYRWVDDAGASFTARFEEGVLTRKTGFLVARAKEEPSPTTETESDTPSLSGEGELAGALHVEGEGDVGEGELREGESERFRIRPIDARRLENEPQRRQVAPPPTRPSVPERPSRVRIAGPSREKIERRREARRDKAKLPRSAYRIDRGAFEMRIYNQSNSAVSVGLRKGERGADFTITANGERRMKVPRGTYRLFFIYSDDPYTLHSGSTIPINQGDYLGDVEVYLMNESYQFQSLGIEHYLP